MVPRIEPPRVGASGDGQAHLMRLRLAVILVAALAGGTVGPRDVRAESPSGALEGTPAGDTSAEGEEKFDRAPLLVEPLPPAAAAVEEITVTAQKREQNIQDVPISITALTSEFLQQTGLTTFDAIGQYVPNLQVTPVTDTRSTSIRIRGIGSTGLNAGIDPSVGVFIDGIYQGRTGLSVASDFIDIERIEVLRGPQGTLFGKNTAAGAISIVSKPPVFEYESTIQGVVGNYSDLELRGTLNAPLIDDVLAARLSGYVVGRSGWDTNLYNNEEVNDANRNGVKLQTLWSPSPDLDLLFIGDYSATDGTCCIPDVITYSGPSVLGVSYQDLAEVTGIPLPKADPFDRVVDANENSTNDVNVWGTLVQGDYQLSGALSDHVLTSLSAYRQFNASSILDGDFSAYRATINEVEEAFQQASTELRLTSPSGERLEYVAGFYFYFSRNDTTNFLGIGPDFLAVNKPIPILIRNNTDFSQSDTANNVDTNVHKTWSYAGFGQSTYYLTPQWSLTGGLRLNYETKSRKGSQISNFTGIDQGPFGPDLFADESFSVFNPSPMGALRYFPTEEVMLYVMGAQGFKSGGFNQLRTRGGLNTQFDDEVSTTAETGARTTWFDRMLTANASFFYTWYKDFQAQSFDGTSFSVTNAGSLTSYGIESDLVLVPHPIVVLGSSLGWNIARYSDFDNAECTAAQIEAAGPLGCTQDLSGEPLDNAPEWTTSSFLQLERELPLRTYPLIGSIRLEHSYRSSIFLQQDLDENLKQGPINLVNLRTGVRTDDALWDLTLWVSNLLNENYLLVGFDTPILNGYAGVNGPPRMFGATLTVNF